MFDITKEESYESLKKWHEELMEHVDPDVVITILGNKKDLEHLRVVRAETATEFANKENLAFMETSALNG